ncbi:SDR family NAD(P)-dependent oxidoreductase [Pyxidicoccus sp. MSG2]|uniref:SDR family NAD(P)-dependent oxidoreductase n=1 Tax=Pyxidicoccus sp. MSG2 TaxID=2996790 RepID=UPI002270726D|nr:SDR family NAD(P)-dependent oxidoreductase [Pyxidicoccus sp. MSG2]MCY1018367.1 SDR family NAD(P)-dependent oxidoreductase [Pyxidicoccus sp. MSG2]
MVEDAGGECLVVPGDVTVGEDVDRAVREYLARYGRIDLLVNDAWGQTYGYFDPLPWEHIQRTVDVTCLGFPRFAHAVLPHFRAQGSGHVLNIQSMLSKGAAPLLSVYTAAKHATLGGAKALTLELHGTGIQVSNVLVPRGQPLPAHARGRGALRQRTADAQVEALHGRGGARGAGRRRAGRCGPGRARAGPSSPLIRYCSQG